MKTIKRSLAVTAVILATLGPVASQNNNDKMAYQTQMTDNNNNGRDRGNNYSWVGLIGLVGLAGLLGKRAIDKRNDTTHYIGKPTGSPDL